MEMFLIVVAVFTFKLTIEKHSILHFSLFVVRMLMYISKAMCDAYFISFVAVVLGFIDDK